MKWDNLFELLKNCNFSELKAQLSEMNEVDIAEFLEELKQNEMLLVFRILPKHISADIFSYLDPENQSHIIQSISDMEIRELVDDLFIDDAVDFLEEVPANVVRRVLSNTDRKTRKLINQFLQYPENSAGSIMTAEMMELHHNYTVDEAIHRIRKLGTKKETIYTCFCIDESRHLIGTVDLRDLILSPETARVHDLMDEDKQLISVHTLDDQEYVADLVRKYDLLNVPVVDQENRLVGIITIDDIVDIIEEENTEDFEKMALLHPSEEEYLKTGIWKLSKNRIIWLLVLMVSATFSSGIIHYFEDVLSAVIGLAAAIPVLMDTGGNAGSQTSTLIIRGIALGEIKLNDFFKIIWKEFRVSLVCGGILAFVNFLRLYFLTKESLMVSFVICITMFLTIIIAKFIGGILPIVAKKIKLDPALMAGPLITTITDSIALFIYFAIAKLLLL